jgi:hypothetical protein
MPVLSVMFCIDAFISMLGMLVFLHVFMSLSGSPLGSFVQSKIKNVRSVSKCVGKTLMGVRAQISAFIFGEQQRGGPSRSSSRRYRRLRRRRLHIHLVQQCCTRIRDYSLLGLRVHQHRHWRRRKERWRKTYKSKRHELKLRRFIV